MLLDRDIRYLLLVHLPINRNADAIRDALIAVLGELPESLRLTLTGAKAPNWVYHDEIAPLLREGVFFAHPTRLLQRDTEARPTCLGLLAPLCVK
jgi:IS30 family transposase